MTSDSEVRGSPPTVAFQASTACLRTDDERRPSVQVVDEFPDESPHFLTGPEGRSSLKGKPGHLSSNDVVSPRDQRLRFVASHLYGSLKVLAEPERKGR
jgi:hypothetical protein